MPENDPHEDPAVDAGAGAEPPRPEVPSRGAEPLPPEDPAVGGAEVLRPEDPAVGGAEALRGGPKLASIGPVTSGALREAGLQPDLEAAEHTPDGLVQALMRA